MKKILASLFFLSFLCGTVNAAAITANQLTSSSDGTDLSEYTTASITPAANKLILLSVVGNHASAASAVPTISGNGLTWVEVATQTFNSIGTPIKRITLFRAMGSSPSTGTITITFAATQTSCFWSVDEFANIDTGGSDGADAIVQAVAGVADSNTSPFSVTLAAFVNTNNATYGTFLGTGAYSPVVGSGFTLLSTVEAHLNEWKNSNDTSVDITHDETPDLAGIAVEIRASGTPADDDITQSLLTEASDNTNLTIYTTASVSPAANQLLLLAVVGLRSSDTTNNVDSVAGNGLTWVEIAEVLDETSDRRVHTLFRAMGSSPSTGVITITFNGTNTRAAWALSEFGNVDTGGADGADAVVQSATGTGIGTQYIATLAAFVDTKNATFGTFATDAAQQILPQEFIEISDNFDVKPQLSTQWLVTNEPDVHANRFSVNWSAIGVEIGNNYQDITATQLEDDIDLTDLTVYSTASITATANRLVLMTVGQLHASSVGTVSSVTGGGLTWVEIDTAAFNTVGSPVKRVTLFRALGGSPSAGVLTITLSKEHTNCFWSITEFAHIDTGGSNGADAIVQAVADEVDNQSTEWTITLAAFGNSANATYGTFSTSAAGTVTVGTGFTQLGSETRQEWRNDNDTSVDITFTTADAEIGGIAVEIKNRAQLSTGASVGARGHRTGFIF